MRDRETASSGAIWKKCGDSREQQGAHRMSVVKEHLSALCGCFFPHRWLPGQPWVKDAYCLIQQISLQLWLKSC